MENTDGFVPIVAVFYAVFHPTEGTKIIHQVPEGSISSINLNNDDSSTLFNFDTVKNYIIPKSKLCNKLISFKISKFRVLGYPVNIENPDYSRNSFNFNFCFVFPYDSDTTPYESAITRMGKMFRVLEEQSFMLSKLDKNYSFFKNKDNMTPPVTASNRNEFNDSNDIMMDTPGHSKTKKINLSSIESLIHQIYQDLNNYSECCIPLDSANSVDIKLFPILPPPANIKAFQVPISTVKLSSLVDVGWDPTMVKILPYINGINSVKKISELADADYLLTKQCIQHLMHYKCIEIIDIFQFNNIYAPTNHIGKFLKVNGMAEECQAYIITGDTNNNLNSLPLLHKESISNSPLSNSFNNSISPFSKPSYFSSTKAKSPNEKQTIHVPSKATLFYLYRSLNQGQTVKEWYIQHRKQLYNIDIRRFINFGVLRGLIYRVHSYPILNSITRAVESGIDGELDELVKNIKSKQNIDLKPSTDNKTKNKKLLKSIVNETNLKTGKSKRKVSFNYNVSVSKHNIIRDIIIESDEDDDDDYLSDDSISNISMDLGNNVEKNNDFESNKDQEIIKLIKLLKGYQHFDSINTELQKSRFEIEELIEKLGSYSIINS